MKWIGFEEKIKSYAVDLSRLYLKEGAIVLVMNDKSHPYSLYERCLPDGEYWASYTANPKLENPDDVSPHNLYY